MLLAGAIAGFKEHAPWGGPDEATNPEWRATAADAGEVIE
jgi:hypothetical protein